MRVKPSLLELARVLVRFDHVARFIVNVARVIVPVNIILSLLCGVLETPLYEFGV
jgi:hypothetical protein